MIRLLNPVALVLFVPINKPLSILSFFLSFFCLKRWLYSLPKETESLHKVDVMRTIVNSSFTDLTPTGPQSLHKVDVVDSWIKPFPTTTGPGFPVAPASKLSFKKPVIVGSIWQLQADLLSLGTALFIFYATYLKSHWRTIEALSLNNQKKQL